MKKFLIGIFMIFTLISCAKPRTDEQKLYALAEVSVELLPIAFESVFGKTDSSNEPEMTKEEKKELVESNYLDIKNEYEAYKKNNKNATVNSYIEHLIKEMEEDGTDKEMVNIYKKLLKEKGLK